MVKGEPFGPFVDVGCHVAGGCGDVRGMFLVDACGGIMGSGGGLVSGGGGR